MNGSTPTNEPDSSERGFWTQRWHKGKIPWDLGSVPADLVSFLDRTPTPTSVLIPGCGSGYEVQAFHGMGHDVTALDFSATAVAHAKELLGPLGDAVIHGDFFKRSEEHTSELQSQSNLVCRLLLEKKKKNRILIQYEKRQNPHYIIST